MSWNPVDVWVLTRGRRLGAIACCIAAGLVASGCDDGGDGGACVSSFVEVQDGDGLRRGYDYLSEWWGPLEPGRYRLRVETKLDVAPAVESEIAVIAR
jgi:hypothetical protein